MTRSQSRPAGAPQEARRPEKAASAAEASSVPLNEIGAEPKAYAYRADEEALAAFAKRLRVPRVGQVAASFLVRRSGSDALVDGEVWADLSRECVISLEPLTESVRETFSIRFTEQPPDDDEAGGDDAVDIEPLPADAIDLEDLAAQQIALAMAPYPKRPEARPPATGGARADDEGASAFAALKSLVDEQKVGE